jgi:hypothetical protein
MVPPPASQCSSCKYFRAETRPLWLLVGSEGLCHRNPPQLIPRDALGITTPAISPIDWLPVLPTWWCGEYKPAGG